jgi:hypothetical protein
MSEKIFLTYTNATAVPYQGTELGHHIVLNYIDSNGAHHTLQGVPEHRFDHNIDKLGAFIREEVLSDGKNNTDSPFQRLQAKTADQGPKPQTAGEDSTAPFNQPHTMVAEGDDLSARWALMRDFADEVNSTGYEYRPISQNSNSFAGGALQRAGFFGPGTEFPERFNRHPVVDPVSGETKSFYVPGFEAPLTNPINTATPLPFPLDPPAPPLVPSNGSATPDRRGFLDGRSVGSPVVPASSIAPAEALSPGRYLGRRIAGQSTAFASDGSVSADRLGLFGNRFGGDTPPDPDPRVPASGPLLGIVSGKPMSPMALPPSVWGQSDSSDATGGDDWFNFLARMGSQRPA